MTKEEIKKQVEEKYLALKQKTYFISFVGYKGTESDFGNTMVNSRSAVLEKEEISKQIAGAMGLDKVILLSVVQLTKEEQEIVDLNGGRL